MTDTIKVGDRVMWRGSFGSNYPRPATVCGITVTDWPREKYGQDRDEASLELVAANRVIFSLTNGHWCYSEQIDMVRTKKLWEILGKPKEELPLYIGDPYFGEVIEELLKKEDE